jgi:uncharacterized iron-regulated protein
MMTLLIALIALTMSSACGDAEGTGETVQTAAFEDSAIVVDYADQVVVPTYELLDQRANDLQVAVDALALAPTDVTLLAAQEAWIATRVPWEQSEGMLFGPVDANGYDPALDSWPVNKTDLEGVLSSSDAIDQAYVKELNDNLKGFHTIEYLLFGEGNSKTAADFTERELDYLKATTAELTRITGLLAESWTTGVNGNPAYRDVFATAGEADNDKFPSEAAAAEQIVAGIVGILGEVADGKIGGPFTSGDTSLVESQFSYNSLTDFTNNIRSVQNAYTGDVPAAGTTGKGLNEFVKAQDAELNTRVEAEIQAAIDALGEVPTPFRDAVVNEADAAKIQAAIDAIVKVRTTFQEDVTPLIQGN